MPRAERPTSYRGPEVDIVARVRRNRAPTTADLRRPENNVNYELMTLWLDTSTNKPWIIIDKANNLAYWVPFTGTFIASLTGDDDELIEPDTDGNIDVQGKTVANATRTKPIWTEGTAASNLIEIEVQVGTERTGSPSNKLDAGLSSYNDTQFTQDAHGYVELKGGNDKPVVQGIIGDEGSGNIADANGDITITGNAVANATHAKPVYIDDTAASASTVDVQVSTALGSAPSDKLDPGLSSFDSDDFNVSIHGFVQLKGSGGGEGSQNIGISYAANTFTVNGSDGAALSADNPAYVTLQDKSSPGSLVTIAVTANQSIIDSGGVTEMVNNLFGVTTGDNWGAYDMPFFLYAVSNDSEDAIAFMISRVPHRSVAPAAASIGKPSSADADTQGSFLSLDDITVGDYDTNPCVCLGSFRMRFTQPGAVNDWTVQTLTNNDGIGNFQEGVSFFMTTGVAGNAASSYFQANGGTAPQFTQQNGWYKIKKDGTYSYKFWGTGCSTSGVGAVPLHANIPLLSSITTYGHSVFHHIPDGPPHTFSLGDTGITTSYLFFTKTGGTAEVTNAAITNANSGDDLGFSCIADISIT